jgi:hypothetical protein
VKGERSEASGLGGSHRTAGQEQSRLEVFKLFSLFAKEENSPSEL